MTAVKMRSRWRSYERGEIVKFGEPTVEALVREELAERIEPNPPAVVDKQIPPPQRVEAAPPPPDVVEKARAEPDPEVESDQVMYPCPHCDYVGKSAHGLKIHAGRRHAIG